MDADELYRLAPEDFTAARDEAAKQARAEGDRAAAAALKALRRPSVAAWLVNRLAQEGGDLLGELLELGPDLARAQAGRDAAALRELGAQRRRLVDAVVGTAVELSGRAVSAAVREEVAATLEAALADPGSAQAVRSGRLVRALSYAGFGGVDLADAVAPATAGPARVPEPAPERPAVADRAAERRRARVAEAEAAAHEAAGRLDDAVRECEAAERTRTAAHEAAEAARVEVDRLAEELTRARAARDAAVAQARAADASADRARAAVTRRQEAAERARRALDDLRRG